jgi:hypothetical protein
VTARPLPPFCHVTPAPRGVCSPGGLTIDMPVRSIEDGVVNATFVRPLAPDTPAAPVAIAISNVRSTSRAVDHWANIDRLTRAGSGPTGSPRGRIGFGAKAVVPLRVPRDPARAKAKPRGLGHQFARFDGREKTTRRGLLLAYCGLRRRSRSLATSLGSRHGRIARRGR